MAYVDLFDVDEKYQAAQKVWRGAIHRPRAKLISPPVGRRLLVKSAPLPWMEKIVHGEKT